MVHLETTFTKMPEETYKHLLSLTPPWGLGTYCFFFVCFFLFFFCFVFSADSVGVSVVSCLPTSAFYLQKGEWILTKFALIHHV